MNTERIKKLAKEKGWSASFLASKIGRSPAYFTDAGKKNGSIPDDKLREIAYLLETTAEYITFQTDTKTPPQRDGDDENITDDEREELELFRCLSLAGQKRAMSYIRFLHEEERAERE